MTSGQRVKEVIQGPKHLEDRRDQEGQFEANSTRMN